jgi:putative Ca2+/H+ antiporter (TMEM165/GDT1 family)
MDWKLFLTTFGAVFLAELGDKTQLATMALAADSRSKLTVFVGASLALVVAAGLGVLVGDSIARFVPPQWIQRGAAVLFVGIGAWLLWSSFAAPAEGA